METPDILEIKRYASRRLYNPEASEYVSLQEIAAIIRSGRDVRIVDQQTGEDVTNSYLVRIVAEQEAEGDPVLPAHILMELVRACDRQAREFVPQAFETAISMMREGQERVRQTMENDPFGEIQKHQRAFFDNFIPAGRRSQSQPNEPEDELERIKRELAELQEKVSKLQG